MNSWRRLITTSAEDTLINLCSALIVGLLSRLGQINGFRNLYQFSLFADPVVPDLLGARVDDEATST